MPKFAPAVRSAVHAHPVRTRAVGRASERSQASWWQRVVLPTALPYLYEHLREGRRVLICCERGDDRSATVAAAALLALFADDAATVRDPGPPGGGSRQSASKDDVRARLALLQGACPAARVSRQLTKELNNFFVSPNGGWLQVLA